MNNLIQKHKSNLWLLLWLALFVVALLWRAQNLDAFGLSNDEGAHLMWGRLAADGYPLYSETYAVQSPLFLESVGLAFRIAGQTIQVGRWAMLMGFALLAVALSWLAYRAGGWLPTLVTMFLLGVSPLIFTFSRLVMAEVPATGWAVSALALCFVYLDRRHRGWLFGSGLLLGLSFITKALNPFVAVPVGLLLFVFYFGNGQRLRIVRNWRGVIGDALIWGAGVVLPIIVLPLFYDPAGLYDQLVLFRSDLRFAISGSWLDTWQKFVVFIQSHWGFWLPAGAGIVTAVRRTIAWETDGGWQNRLLNPKSPAHFPLIWIVWLMAGVLMLLWHAPLFPHHFIVLLPPLILLGAGFIGDIVALGQRYRWAYALWLVVAVAALNLPAALQTNQKTAAIVTGGREAEALKLLEAVSAPADFVMGDSQLLIFMADRRTPPPLGDVALVAIKAGRQTSARMIALTQEYQAPAVVQWSLRLPWLPDYLTWVEENYLARRVWDNDHIVYFAPRFSPEKAVPHAREDQLGESLRLRGYKIDDTAKAGDTLSLKVYWQTDAPLTDDYTVFTQLLDSNGAFVQGWDSQPLRGHFPTSQWPANEIITDIVQLSLPADLPPGDYTLITGMYVLETLERLLTSQGADHLVLTVLPVE